MTAWLIEVGGHWCIGSCTSNPEKVDLVAFTDERAFRFARRVDAEAFARFFKLTVRVAEHSWEEP